MAKTREQFIKGLNGMTMAKLLGICRSSNYPEKEWNILNKAQLVEYITQKYDSGEKIVKFKMEKTDPKSFIPVIIGVLLAIVISHILSSTSIKGTYEWDYHGYKQTVILNTGGRSGGCTWIGEDGSQSKESYDYYRTLYDRPLLEINGIALIDTRNKRVYESEDDFKAYRNSVPCTKTK